MANNKITYSIGMDINKNDLNTIKTELQNLQRKFASLGDFSFATGMNFSGAKSFFNSLGTEFSKVQKDINQIGHALDKSFNARLNTIDFSKLNKELDGIDLNNIYQSLKKIGPEAVKSFDTMTTRIFTSNKALKQSHEWLDKIKTSLLKTTGWYLSSSAINNMANSIQQAYQYTLSLDKSLNNIQIVTKKSAEQMADFARVANQTAKELGVSTTDYTNAALIYYQQGLNDKDAQMRANVTSKVANVTKQSTEAVSEQLTALWNGYNVALAESEIYVDKLAAVAAASASDLEELATGMSKVASSANMLGVSADSLSAQLATIISVTRQAPESVGTALKTIYARISDIEAGLDGETSLGQYTADMEAMGVNVLDSSGKLKDLQVVIEEVGNSWDSYSREQQIALAQTMAGTRQYNNMMALFSGWDMYKDQLQISKTSQGELQKQQDIYLESAEAHIEKMKTSWESFYNSLFTGQDFNGVYDALAKIADVLASMVESLGGGANLLGIIVPLTTRLFSTQIAQGLGTMRANLESVALLNQEQTAKQNVLSKFSEVSEKSVGFDLLTQLEEKLLKLENSKFFQGEQWQNIQGILRHNVDEIGNMVQANEKLNKELEKTTDLLTSITDFESLSELETRANIDKAKQIIESEKPTIENLAKTTDSAIKTNQSGVNKRIAQGIPTTKQNNLQNFENIMWELVADFRSPSRKSITQGGQQSSLFDVYDVDQKVLEQYDAMLSKLMKDLHVGANTTTESFLKNFKKLFSGFTGDELNNEIDNFIKRIEDILKLKDQVYNNFYEPQADNRAEYKTELESLKRVDFVFPRDHSELLAQLKDFRKFKNDKKLKGPYKEQANEIFETLLKDLGFSSSGQGVKNEKILERGYGTQALQTFFEELQKLLISMDKEIDTTLGKLSEKAELNAEVIHEKVEITSEDVNKVSKNVLDLEKIEHVIQGMSTLGQLSMGIHSFKGVFDIFSNENLSNADKMLQIFSNLMITLPMVLDAAKKIYTDFDIVQDTIVHGKTLLSLFSDKDLEIDRQHLLNMTVEKTLTTMKVGQESLITKQKEIQMALEGANTVEDLKQLGLNEAQIKQLTQINTLEKTRGSSLIGLVAKNWKLVLVIAAVAAAVGGLVYVFTKEEREIAKLEERLSEATSTYNTVKSAAESFKNTISDYKDAQDALSKLDKGTREYKEAILEANEQAIKLLETNKELTKYASRDENGLITISEEGIDNLLDKQLERTALAQIDYVNASTEAANASTTLDIKNFRKEHTYTEANGGYWDIILGEYGEGNINLKERGQYVQPDGSISTVNSMSFWSDEESKEILVPLIQKVGDKWVELSEEEAIETYKQTGEYLGKFENVVDANLYAQKLHEAQEAAITNQKSDYDFDTKIPEELIQDIMDYMQNSDTNELFEEDLYNIDSFNSATASLQEAIIDNIGPLGELANSVNAAKKQTELLAESATQSYLQMQGIIDNDGKLTVEEIVTQRIMNNAGGVDVSNEAKERSHDAQDFNFWAFQGGYTKETRDQALQYYEDTYGVKLKQDNAWNKFLRTSRGASAKYSIYSTDGLNSKTGELTLEEIVEKYYEPQILKEKAQQSKEQAKNVTQNINNLAKQFGYEENSDIAKVLANSYVGEDGKIKINEDDTLLTQEQAEQMSNTLLGLDKDTFASALGYATEQADKVYEEFEKYLKERQSMSDNEVFFNLGKTVSENATTLQDQLLAGEINDSTSLSKSEEYKKLSNSIDGLLKKYPELEAYARDFKNESLAGTEQWAQAFYKVKEAADELKIEGLKEEYREAADELFKDEDGNELSLELALEDENFQNELDAVLDKNYEISVAIHASAEDAFESFEGATENMAEQAQKIGAGYVVAADDIRELNNAFPGIIEGMQSVGDGTVKLNKQVVQSAMEMAEAEMQASAKTTLKTLQDSAITLRGKQKIYQSMANAAFELAKSEINAEENKKTIKEGFTKLEAENDTISTQTELNNAKNVADDSNDQARVTASNWTEAYQNAADSAVAFAETAASVHQVAQTGDLSKLKKHDFNVTYIGQNAQSSEIAETAQLKSAYEAAANGSGDYYALGQAFQNAANALGQQANDIKGMIAQIGATSIETGYGLAGVAKGAGYDRSGSGKDKKDNLKDEKDIYHDINIILKQISTELDRLEKQEEKLVGQDLIDNLNEQWGRLQDTIDATNEKIKIARGEMSRLQGELGAKGVTFNPDGTIANYAAAYNQQLATVNAVINHYNSLSEEAQKGYKNTVEQAEKNWKEFLDDISEYDELVSEMIPELEDEIQAAIDEQIEIQIEKFNMEIELRLDMAEAEREWNEFKKRIIDDIEDDDILGNASAKLLDYNSYYKEDGTGVIQKNTQHVNEIIEQLKSIEATGTSSIYGDNEAQALEDLKTYYEQLMSDLTDVHDLIDEIRESYLDMMDEAQEKFDEQVETYEYIRDLLTHDMDLITMVYGDEAYDKLVDFYEKQEDNYNKQLDFQRQQKDFWKAQMDSLEEGSDEWQKAKENWMSAVEEWNSLVEEAIENLQDKYLNAINNIFANLNDKVTGGLGLDYVEQEWDLINKNADQYLDTINAVFETQQLENKYLDAIDNTDNISAQRKLNDLMKEEIKALEQKDKLTQYDIDRANLKYEIALKQIALEEAQQTKSSMRLRRDSQGNYRYEFVADNDAIAEAEDELSVLQNQLYNMDVEQYRSNLDQLYEIYVEWQEALAEAAQINDPEKRARAELEINEQYGELINSIVEGNEVVRTNLRESAFDELVNLHQMELEEVEALSQAEKDIMLEEMIPQWTSGVQTMADTFAGEGGFIPTCKDALDELDGATKDYEDSLVDLQYQGGFTFNDIVAGENEAIYTAQGLLQANSDLINTYQAELQAINGVIGQLQSLVTQYNAARDAANAAADAAYRYWAALNNQAANANTSNTYTPHSYGTSGSRNNTNGTGVNTSNSGGTTGNSNSVTSGGNTKTGEQNRYQLTYILSNGKEQATVEFTAGSAAEVRQKIASFKGINAFAIKNLTKGTSALGSYQTLSNFAFFKTGGYTGEWNSSEGRIGVLHQKELVLNQRDTENILGAVEIMRHMTNSIDNSIYSRVADFTSGIGVAAPELENGTLEQNVHIEANFPNVQSSTEIEDAINNLVNIASQRATGTKK